MEALKKETYYTYADYADWELKEGERFELIDGIPYAMSAPSPRHQEISMALSRLLSGFLLGRKCRVFAAPFDVRLNGRGDFDDTVVQPDLLVICDKSKIDEKGCNGAPDIVIEIMSPSSKKLDLLIKYRKYQNAGVREYWIVDIELNIVEVYLFENNRREIMKYCEDDIIRSSVLDGFEVNVRDVFGEE